MNYRPHWELNNHKHIQLMKNGNLQERIALDRERVYLND